MNGRGKIGVGSSTPISLLVVALPVALANPLAFLAAAELPGPLLTNVQQILSLGLEGVRHSSPRVQLQGVVTFPMDGSVLTYVQDATAGIQVSYTNSDAVLRAGQRVQVDGFAGSALFAPMILDGRVQILGTAPMPEPRRIPAARLAAGEAFGQWVAIEGVIRDIAWNVDRRIMFISSGGLRFHTIVRPCLDSALPPNWIDARVELRGICWTDADRENKPTGFTLYTPGTNHITFLPSPSKSAFEQPVLSVSGHPELRRQSDDRVKVAGQVLFQAPAGTVYVRSEGDAIEARLLVPLARMNPKGRYLDRPPAPPLPPGSRVELVGAPTQATFAPALQDVEVRLTGAGAAPDPVRVSLDEMISGRRDRELVSIHARFLGLSQRDTATPGRHESLLLQSGDAVFEAMLAPGSTNHFPDLAKNSVVEAVGLCLVQPAQVAGTRSFRLLVRDPAELRVIGQWSAWRSPEALRIAGVAGALGLAALGWIWLLRRRVAERTAALATVNESLQSEIEERKRAQSDLGRALEAEKELGQLKSRFVSLVSHEFRTPLGIILSAADILRKYGERLQPERRAEHLQEIHDATKHMGSMMEQVLVLGRAESGRIVSKPAPIDLPSFCQKLAEEQLAATQGRCPITFTSGPVDGTARGDEGLLRHIFRNLLSNAVKYSPEGRPVEFTLQRRAADAVFAVRDRGIGIPAGDAARLFTAFHRCTNVGEVPGSGLGLLIVKRCVELHGGAISFQSREGEGTTFTVRLPLFDAKPAS